MSKIKMNKLATVIAMAALGLSLVLTGCNSDDKKGDDAAKAEAAGSKSGDENGTDDKVDEADGAKDSKAKDSDKNKSDDEKDGTSKDADESENSDASSLADSFMEVFGGSYLYENSDELEERVFEIRSIDGDVYMEYLGVYDYAGAEIEVEKKLQGDGANDAEYQVKMHPYSGFSYAGNYWGVGQECSIKKTKEGIEITNSPFLEDKTLTLKTASDKAIHQPEKEAVMNSSVRDVWGSWRCKHKVDGKNHYVYLELTPEGKFYAVDKVAEFPANVFIGQYTAEMTGGGVMGDVLCEQFAYGDMPYEWKLGYDDVNQCPKIYDEYSFGDPLGVPEGETLRFEKTVAGSGNKIKPGPEAASTGGTHKPSMEEINKLEEAIVIFPIGTQYEVNCHIDKYSVDAVTNWAVLTDNSEDYAGLTFEKGTGKTPIYLDYPGIDAGEQASYMRTDADKLEKAMQGFYGTGSKFERGEYYDYVIDDDYLTVWGQGYYVSYEGISTKWSDFKYSVDGDELTITAKKTVEDIMISHDYDYKFTFEYDEDSSYMYSLTDFEITNEDHDTTYTQDVLTDYEGEIRTLVNSGNEGVNEVDVKAGADGCDWARKYYFLGDDLIFAYYYNSKSGAVDNRYYFWEGCMIEWIEGNGNNDANRQRHYASDKPRDSRWKETQNTVLSEASKYR